MSSTCLKHPFKGQGFIVYRLPPSKSGSMSFNFHKRTARDLGDLRPRLQGYAEIAGYILASGQSGNSLRVHQPPSKRQAQRSSKFGGADELAHLPHVKPGSTRALATLHTRMPLIDISQAVASRGEVPGPQPRAFAYEAFGRRWAIMRMWNCRGWGAQHPA